jgi:arsenical pump membrane protein
MVSELFTGAHLLTWAICAAAVAGVISRPFDWPEAVWVVTGSLILLVFGLIPLHLAGEAVLKGTDVYLFLIGMMLLAEFARREGLFDWIAAYAVRKADGSARKLFVLVYAVGTIVTIFLSNDAAAVVLTPAVYAATKSAGAKPLPYLYICAFIANAASFVLPISNPANLVVFGQDMPSLLSWLGRFLAPSIVSIALTFVVLWFTQKKDLSESLSRSQEQPRLEVSGKFSAAGICLTAVALLLASAFHVDLGAPTFACGMLTAVTILVRKREGPVAVTKDISWQVLPLVAGLFILVESLDRTGLFHPMTAALKTFASQAEVTASFITGVVVAVVCNLVNNLPLGLIAGTAVTNGHLPTVMTSGMLIGVDLGPNLSVTGSLATILWILALRREGQNVTTWQFLKLGMVVMPPALLGALVCCIGLATVFH